MISLWNHAPPVTTLRIMEMTGFSYPAVVSALKNLGGNLERQSDRRVKLRLFPREEYLRLLAGSEKARSTVRFADRSGKPRPPEAHLRRLETLAPPGVALGGVLGAKHYLPELDLVGAPRLDLSLHCPREKREMDLSFVERLDPALAIVDDPLIPGCLAVHAVRHADPLFLPRAEGLAWADPVECLLDLHECRLEMQANQFLEFLRRRRAGAGDRTHPARERKCEKLWKLSHIQFVVASFRLSCRTDRAEMARRAGTGELASSAFFSASDF